MVEIMKVSIFEKQNPNNSFSSHLTHLRSWSLEERVELLLSSHLHFESHSLVLCKIDSAQLHFESHSPVLRKIDSAQVSFTWTLLHFEFVFLNLLNLLFFESAHSLTGTLESSSSSTSTYNVDAIIDV
ncbi:uncharacterized protein LOC114279510 [Camellia sinensis]|uniref:uncharacterized protein LOC114279510 n=1 Tax=Camellia sinensis TaxID=4442 RepID=UPI0010358BCF|nr:uncharacterized protein LOC114279510 [Camellia sinensis]